MSEFNNYIQDLQENIKRGGERSHYPSLQRLIEGLMIGVNARIEEKGNQAGIPDLTIRKNDRIWGYIEAKDIDIDLNKIQKTAQLKRYLESNIGYNLILTNYLEFWWYVDGECEKTAKLANLEQGEIILVNDLQPIKELLQSFFNQKAKDINNYYDLAKEMAAYTKTIRNAIQSSLEIETTTEELNRLKETFKKLLLLDIDNDKFADMYSQTIAYGLFTAKIGHAQNPGQFAFNRTTASIYISDRIPFLKGLFDLVLGTDSVSKIHKSIENLIDLFNTIDMTNILENFGQETRTQDPVIHFYETFLAAYESSLRKSRGVYYTPEPVVNFIVRAVDDILDKVFDLQYGLGNRKVTILDPATGTGTFLYAVIKQIRDNVKKYGIDNWNSFLRDTKLVNRLFGFELLMTPYTIAHLKLGLLLGDLGYKFAPEERLKVYLTNALEEGIKEGDLIPGITQIIAEESSQAGKVKTEIPVMVVLGNPPYSVSSQNASKRKRVLNQDERYLADVEYTGLVWNRIYKTGKAGKTITELTHIGELLELYKGRVRLEKEKNIQPLDDDYIKFIRFAQDQIQKNPKGYGIIGFITNHSYLNGLIHRGMREELLKYFDTLYIMDLHGNSLLKETTPDGNVDQNVFDIQQGVAILIAVREKSEPDYFSTAYKSRDGIKEMAKVLYYDLWGSREEKYKFLESASLDSVNWIELQPTEPNYFFAPKNFDLATEYNQGWNVTDIFPVNSTGVKTHRDHFVIDFDLEQLRKRIEDFRNLSIADSEIINKYSLNDNPQWNISDKRKSLNSCKDWQKYFQIYLYRPFDFRYYYNYEELVDRPRKEVMYHMIQQNNLALVYMRQVALNDNYNHFIVSDCIVDNRAFYSNKGTMSLAPLYIYPNTENKQTNLFLEKTPNLSPKFLEAIKEKLGKIPTPEEIFYYAYAIFHSPTYRTRYAEFLKIDFPRLPLTSNQKLFHELAIKGEELVNLHLMKSDILNTLTTTYQTIGNNQVSEVTYNSELQRVYINKESYFTDIPSHIWEFKIGGYQVLDKWLKDRKNANRKLFIEEINHYQKIVIALTKTLRLMQEIDRIIPGFPID
ncbi:N-6 DNA methylase [Dolichospermum sp. ST_con]|nr:N-6 DNA methylase [Dolichospermum sp. ST_con]MDD1419418.1 N-6 DNA methylase [Dolichospermum sp. ST_sed1]MDD1424055.1 N-6 DNA methylase [Dolichospermum sp. ST_sed9]MDD1429917.1 N-6 DNA methylase [Dolichospermum sp. ST_sed6]MDD1435670.1 N-6 DNA methylase [Dolichospermum sp. ST_sed10]MDD1439345.1 N-6 DNA methylase [Dolichospermum sp. ST_sed3]MDD1446246.1 N-6 DNA methylase [Dolichospermum sp. ST_sed8]MDD1456020.1 N-6 DNA methylase [Dolichospermum sp. ST_sed7]MDD1460229.1 N-6 DNA methylase [D